MIDILKPLIQQFMPFAQQEMGFSRPPKLFLRQDEENAANPLGKTGFYDPQAESITLYTTGRHPKDVMRSLAHELMHHTQKCNGDFDNMENMGEEGYAQNNPHMRSMEIQAYQASIVFRDWEDSTKGTIYYEHLQKGDKSSMSTKNWKNGELKSLLSEAWGFKMDLGKLNNNKTHKKVLNENNEDIFAPNHYCVHHGGVQHNGSIEMAEAVKHNYNEKLGRVTHYDMKLADGTILENVAAEDIQITDASLAESHGGKKKPGKRDDEKEESDSDFPDLTGDGKVTQADVLKGRGVKLKEKADKNTGMSGVKGDDDDDTYMGHIKEDSGEEEGRHYDDDRMSDNDHIKAIEHHLDALRRDRDYDEDHEALEEDGAKRKGDPRLRRPDADRLRESVAKLRKAGFSKTQIKEFLSAAYSQTLKG